MVTPWFVDDNRDNGYQTAHLNQAATSATAATFPRSCVATVALAAAVSQEGGRYRFQASSKSLR